MTYSWLCDECGGSGYVEVGRMKSGRVGTKPLSKPDPQNLRHLRCRCGGKALVTYS